MADYEYVDVPARQWNQMHARHYCFGWFDEKGECLVIDRARQLQGRFKLLPFGPRDTVRCWPLPPSLSDLNEFLERLKIKYSPKFDVPKVSHTTSWSPELLTCALHGCGREFIQRKPDQRFCSAICQRTAWRLGESKRKTGQAIMRKCAYCRKDFVLEGDYSGDFAFLCPICRKDAGPKQDMKMSGPNPKSFDDLPLDLKPVESSLVQKADMTAPVEPAVDVGDTSSLSSPETAQKEDKNVPPLDSLQDAR